MKSTDGMCEWRLPPNHRAQSRTLAEACGTHPVIARLLWLRGAATPDAARRFLNPLSNALSDPFLLPDVEIAVARLTRARNAGERVLVFGDYDVDGISGTALLVRALRRFGIKYCSYGLPHRLEEGYGLSPARVEQAIEAGVSLIVTVDNGIAAHDAIERANAGGIDVIVTDHHSIERDLPPALAVINPKRLGPSYVGADLCGAAVALKLAAALTGEWHDLDLAALGTVADVVTLRGENRDLVAQGLRDMRARPRPGLRELAQVAGVAIAAVRSEDLAFQLGPRINAGGRMGDGLTGLELLLTDSPSKARVMAEELDAANEERRAIENDTLEEALAMLKTSFNPAHRTIVLSSREWHRGVIGIVASRIQSRYYRPIVLIALDEDGVGRGSARSVAGFNVASALEACKDHLVACGGHAAAAGLTIHEQSLQAFTRAFERQAALELPQGDLRKVLDIDAQVSLTEIDGQLVRTLELLQPFGQGNPSPVFCAFGVQARVDSWRELRGGHMKVVLKDGPKLIDAIGFRMAERLRALNGADALDVAFTPQLNTWRGETTVQLVLKDVRVAP